VSWVEVFAVLVASHLTGDFILQTDWQAAHKSGGLGRDPVSRRALVSHLTTYALAFVPALVWIGSDQGTATAVGIAALIVVPHLVQDDGRLLTFYVHRVKRSSVTAGDFIFVAVDQSFHVLALFGAALVAA
jgi:Protein of unknown function (DUF3307)